MRFLNYHAPNTVRAFFVPDRGIRRWDQEAVVYDVRIRSDRILRHYSFDNHWFELNCSLDSAGRLITESGPIDWAFNCDISTPHFIHGPDVYNKDLWLDVLVAPDGNEHLVIDQEDFERAVDLGWATHIEREGACSGLNDLLAIIRTEGLIAFLERICPFKNVSDCGD